MANEKKNLKTEKELTASGKKTVKSAETAADAKKAVKKAMPKEEWWLVMKNEKRKKRKCITLTIHIISGNY